MTIEKPTVLDMETIAYNLHVEGRNSRSEMLYKFVAEYKANIQKLARLTAIETAAREARIALTFYREWMHEHGVGETRYPFGAEVERKLAALLGGKGTEA